MKISRRNMLISAGLASAAAIPIVRAQSHEGHDMSKMPGMEMPPAEKPAATSTRTRSGKVRTLNGWTLPFRMNNGVKEFHLVAEEFEHEWSIILPRQGLDDIHVIKASAVEGEFLGRQGLLSSGLILRR